MLSHMLESQRDHLRLSFVRDRQMFCTVHKQQERIHLGQGFKTQGPISHVQTLVTWNSPRVVFPCGCWHMFIVGSGERGSNPPAPAPAQAEQTPASTSFSLPFPPPISFGVPSPEPHIMRVNLLCNRALLKHSAAMHFRLGMAVEHFQGADCMINATLSVPLVSLS